MNIPNRTWNEQDFSELYQEQPKIVTSTTYITVHLLVSHDANALNDDGREHEVWIDVKIPSHAQEEVFRCLMYKALYYYYLDCKIDNPLYRAACVVFFQSFNGFEDWYNLSKCNRTIKKGTKFFPITLTSTQSIHRYVPLASLSSDTFCQNSTKVLARSRKNSKYYNLHIYSKNSTASQDYLLILHDRYIKMQHPFLCALEQYHESANEKCFVFEHHSFTISQLLNSPIFKLSKQQCITYFIEVLLALVYLEQQNILLSEINFDHILIGFDGHVSISEEAMRLEFNRNQTMVQSETKIKKNASRFKFLEDLLNKLSQKTEIKKMEIKQIEDFVNFIEILAEKKKSSLKDLLSHTIIHQFDINKILQKSLTLLPTPISLSIPPFPTFHPVPKQCLSLFATASTSNNPYASSRFPYTYQSYQLTALTSNQQIVSKYQYCSQSVSKPVSSRVLRARRNHQNYSSTRSQDNEEQGKSNNNTPVLLERKTSKGELFRKLAAIEQQNTNIKSGAMKSPYIAVLKKQCSLQRKKKANF